MHQVAAISRVQGRVVLATPIWVKKQLQIIARDQDVEFENVDFLHPPIDYLLFPLIYFARRVRRISELWLALFPLLIVIPISIIYVSSLDAYFSAIFILSLAAVGLKRQIRSLFKSRLLSILDWEFQQLIFVSNRKAEKDQSTWLLPSPHYEIAKKLKRAHIVVVPDLMNVQFPILFAPHNSAILESVRTILNQSTKIITYSENVKTEQIVRAFPEFKDKIFVIPNAPTYNLGRRKEFKKELEVILPKNYFIFASQFRPYKNFSNLFIGLNIARTKRPDLELGLLTTADLKNNPEVQSRLRRLDLENFVQSFPKLSGEELNELQHRAIANICPSFEEGGFYYFPFSEAWSVGTPVIASMSKANLETLIQYNVPTEISKNIFFEPNNPWQLANLMIQAADDRSSFLKFQMTSLSSVMSRNWNEVAKEYILTANS